MAKETEDILAESWGGFHKATEKEEGVGVEVWIERWWQEYSAALYIWKYLQLGRYLGTLPRQVLIECLGPAAYRPIHLYRNNEPVPIVG